MGLEPTTYGVYSCTISGSGNHSLTLKLGGNQNAKKDMKNVITEFLHTKSLLPECEIQDIVLQF